MGVINGEAAYPEPKLPENLFAVGWGEGACVYSAVILQKKHPDLLKDCVEQQRARLLKHFNKHRALQSFMK